MTDYTVMLDSMKKRLSNFEKVPYGEAIGAPPPYNTKGDPVWNDPEPYYIERAITAVTDLLARAEAAEARAEKAEKERDAAYGAIEQLVNEHELPVEICREICVNHDGVCSERAKIGFFDTCRGFKLRSPYVP